MTDATARDGVGIYRERDLLIAVWAARARSHLMAARVSLDCGKAGLMIAITRTTTQL